MEVSDMFVTIEVFEEPIPVTREARSYDGRIRLVARISGK